MLEGAHAAFAFTSGMAALAAITRLLKSGDELLLGEDIYGGMHRLVSRVTSTLHGVKIKFVDTTDLAKVQAAITRDTKMLHMESPSNPLMRITDIRGLAELLHAHGVLLSIDSTMMSPILQQPLFLGADIVVHSATKFFGGHSDVMGGLVCLKNEENSKKIAFFQNAEGSGMDPNSCWLFLRGIKTLALRVEKSQANAQVVAEYLAKHPMVKELFYPGMKPRRGDEKAERAYRIHFSQCRGAGCVMSFTTGSVPVSRRLIDALRIFKLTVSFGSVNSLCEMPCVLSHASIPSDQRKLPDDLVRLSIGIEDPEDLIHDISQAFDLAADGRVTNVRAVRRRDTADAEQLEPEAASGSSTTAGKDSRTGAESPENREDALSIARAEVTRMAGTIRVLTERMARMEAEAAGSEAARRQAGGSPSGYYKGLGGSSAGENGGLSLSTVIAAGTAGAVAAAMVFSLLSRVITLPK